MTLHSTIPAQCEKSGRCNSGKLDEIKCDTTPVLSVVRVRFGLIPFEDLCLFHASMIRQCRM